MHENEHFWIEKKSFYLHGAVWHFPLPLIPLLMYCQAWLNASITLCTSIVRTFLTMTFEHTNSIQIYTHFIDVSNTIALLSKTTTVSFWTVLCSIIDWRNKVQFILVSLSINDNNYCGAMNANPLEVQAQIMHHSNNMGDNVKGLYDWEDEIKEMEKRQKSQVWITLLPSNHFFLAYSRISCLCFFFSSS